MGAIAGIIDWSGRRVGEEDLVESRVSDVLCAYGEPSYWSGRVGPGHAVVAGFGATPEARMCRIPDRITVVGDVHLVNRDELQAQLGARVAARSSDLELMAAAYLQWGTGLTERVSGWFAMAIVDERDASAYLIRDHAGVRPLVTARRHGRVYFASNALALTGLDEIGHSLDHSVIANMLVLGYGTGKTVVSGVSWLGAGNYLRTSPETTTEHRWWQEFPVRPVKLRSIGDHADELRAALDLAVVGSVRGASRPGVLLSGGLDSSSVAAVLAQTLAPQQVHAYTSVPPANWSGQVPAGFVAHERDEVRALTAMHPNIRSSFVDVRNRKLATTFEMNESIWELGGSPILNGLNGTWVGSISEDAMADGVDVLLDGGFGNLGFSADSETWLVDLFFRGRLVELVREINAWSTHWSMSRLRTVRRDLIKQSIPARYRAKTSRWKSENLTVQSIAASAIGAEALEAIDLDAVLERWAKPHPRGWTRRPDYTINLFADQADYLTAANTFFGITRRDPLSERRLLETTFRQPDMWRRHRGHTRAICRTAMRSDLPPQIVDRWELGAQMPDWFDRMTDARAEIAQEVEAMRDHSATREIFDIAKLERLVREWPDRDQTRRIHVIHDYKLALSRAIFLGRYIRWFEARADRIRAGGPTTVVKRWWSED